MGYAGQYHDYETGFIYLRARYYSPAVGRFINEDPIRDGLNWYVYCGNNPVRYVDPWGLKTYLAVVGEDKASNNNAFMNNVNTFIEDHPDDDVIVINAADYDSEDALMSAIIAESENCAGIDGLLIESHGTTSALIVSSRYSLSCDANWGDIHFNQNATIVFSGCNTEGKQWSC